MLITPKNVTKKWVSPDNRVTIWELQDQNGTTWATRSQSIADSEGQTLELTTTVSNTGKTYLVRPPKDAMPQAQTQIPSVGILPEQGIARFEEAVQAFSDAVDKLTDHTRPEPDYVPTEIPPYVEDALSKAIDAFGGGEIVDDVGKHES